MSKTCEQCGKAFEPSKYNPKQRFCPGGKCRAKWECTHQYNPTVCRCQYCNKVFTPKRADRSKYCTEHRTLAAVKTRGIVPVFVSVCVTCGCHSNKVHCSDDCEKLATKAATVRYGIATKVLKPRPCKECSKQFTPEYGNKKRTFCSDECGRKYGRRVGKASRRARKASAGRIDRIDPIKVFERDGWKCHLCKKHTPRELRGTIKNMAPELDHIIPLAQGGSHTWDNVACACRKCNGAKGSQLIGQQMLPVFASV